MGHTEAAEEKREKVSFAFGVAARVLLVLADLVAADHAADQERRKDSCVQRWVSKYGLQTREDLRTHRGRSESASHCAPALQRQVDRPWLEGSG